MITKRAYEKYFRYHDFRNYLTKEETITGATVIAVSPLDLEEEIEGIVDMATPHNDTFVKYRLQGGEVGDTYILIIRIETSNDQLFEDRLTLKIV